MIAIDTWCTTFGTGSGSCTGFGPSTPMALPARPGGCADIIETVAQQIDAKQFSDRHQLRRGHGIDVFAEQLRRRRQRCDGPHVGLVLPKDMPG